MNSDNLATAADLAQFYSLYLLLRDASNEQIMHELQHQNQAYLEEILKRIKKIEDNIDKYK